MSSSLPLLWFTIVYQAVVSTVAADAPVVLIATMAPPTSVVASTRPRPVRQRFRDRGRAGGEFSPGTFIAFLSGATVRCAGFRPQVGREVRRGRVATAGCCRSSRSTGPEDRRNGPLAGGHTADRPCGGCRSARSAVPATE